MLAATRLYNRLFTVAAAWDARGERLVFAGILTHGRSVLKIWPSSIFDFFRLLDRSAGVLSRLYDVVAATRLNNRLFTVASAWDVWFALNFETWPFDLKNLDKFDSYVCSLVGQVSRSTFKTV